MNTVRPGDPLTIRAQDWNELARLVDGSRGSSTSADAFNLAGDLHRETVVIKNQTGAALAVGSLVFFDGVSSSALSIATNSLQSNRGPVLESNSVVSTDSRYRHRFGVAIEPIPNNGFGRVATSGFCMLLFGEATGANKFARIADTLSVVPTTDANGEFEIIEAASGAGLALVRFNDREPYLYETRNPRSFPGIVYGGNDGWNEGSGLGTGWIRAVAETGDFYTIGSRDQLLILFDIQAGGSFSPSPSTLADEWFDAAIQVDLLCRSPGGTYRTLSRSLINSTKVRTFFDRPNPTLFPVSSNVSGAVRIDTNDFLALNSTDGGTPTTLPAIEIGSTIRARAVFFVVPPMTVATAPTVSGGSVCARIQTLKINGQRSFVNCGTATPAPAPEEV